MRINLDLALLQMYPPAQLERVVRQCEDLGYRAFRYGNEKYFRDPWIGLTLAAQASSRLRLSTFIQDPFTLHPALTAVAIATLDELSGGRAELVLGPAGAAAARWATSGCGPRAPSARRSTSCAACCAGSGWTTKARWFASAAVA